MLSNMWKLERVVVHSQEIAIIVGVYVLYLTEYGCDCSVALWRHQVTFDPLTTPFFIFFGIRQRLTHAAITVSDATQTLASSALSMAIQNNTYNFNAVFRSREMIHCWG